MLLKAALPAMQSMPAYQPHAKFTTMHSTNPTTPYLDLTELSREVATQLTESACQQLDDQRSNDLLASVQSLVGGFLGRLGDALREFTGLPTLAEVASALTEAIPSLPDGLQLQAQVERLEQWFLAQMQQEQVAVRDELSDGRGGSDTSLADRLVDVIQQLAVQIGHDVWLDNAQQVNELRQLMSTADVNSLVVLSPDGAIAVVSAGEPVDQQLPVIAMSDLLLLATTQELPPVGNEPRFADNSGNPAPESTSAGPAVETRELPVAQADSYPASNHGVQIEPEMAAAVSDGTVRAKPSDSLQPPADSLSPEYSGAERCRELER